MNLQNLTQMTLIQLVKFHFILMLVMTKGLQLMASTLGSAFQKEEVGVLISPLASSLAQVLLMEDLVLKNSSKIHECMKVESSSNVNFFKLIRGEEILDVGAT